MALFQLLGGAVCIAFAPILVRLSETGPVASGFWRMAIAFVLMQGFSHLWHSRHEQGGKGEALPSLPWSLKAWLFGGIAFLFAGDLTTWHISLQYTTITNSLLIVNATVFVVAIGAWFFFDERLPWTLIVGICVGFSGLVVLILGGIGIDAPSHSIGAKYTAESGTLWGDLMSVATNFFYAAYLLQLRHARRWFPASQIMRTTNGICAVLLLFIAGFLQEQILPTTWYGWGVVVALAIICQVLGQTLIAKGIDRLPMGFSSMVLLVQPVVGAIASWIILYEPIGWHQLFGGGLVFLGLYLGRPRAMPAKPRLGQ